MIGDGIFSWENHGGFGGKPSWIGFSHVFHMFFMAILNGFDGGMLQRIWETWGKHQEVDENLWKNIDEFHGMSDNRHPKTKNDQDRNKYPKDV